jgi:uncharacterized membrane protein YhaH (DUF805 family)
MSTVNPYAPPRAPVADIEPQEAGVQPVRNWSAKGRIGRLRYLAHMMAAYLLFLIPGFLAGFLQGIGLKVLGGVLLGALFLAYLYFLIVKSIQRSHDMNWSGWTVILAIIPFASLIWLVRPGTRGSNSYGAPPPPNTLGVKILGLAVPVIAIIGILAAIALPAYQGYTKRAQSGQVR